MTPLPRAAACSVAVLGTSVLLLACDRGSAPRPEPPKLLPAHPSVSANPSPAAPSPLESRALAAYVGMRSAEAQAYAAPGQVHLELRRYAADRALATIAQTVVMYRELGIVVRGRPEVHPRAVQVEPGARPQRVTVVDCFDSSHWTPVRAETGQAVSVPGQAERYLVTAHVTLVADRWLVTDVIADRSRSC